MKSFKVMIMLVVALLSVASVQAQDNNEDVIFYESFDEMNGEGGNDGKWDLIAGFPTGWTTKGAINDGWSIEFTAQPASKCIMIGTSGILKTPKLSNLDGNAILTFKAGSSTNWTTKKAKLYLAIENGGDLDIKTITLDKGKFNDYSIKITDGTTDSKIKFFTDSRMALFLDEVKIVKEKTPETPDGPTPTAISTVKKNTTVSDNKVYNLNGQLVGTSTQGLKQGVYIINNKKVVVK